MTSVLQKLVWPATRDLWLKHGLGLLAGPVVDAALAAQFRTPGEVLEAHGAASGDTDAVDLLRFRPDLLTRVAAPREGDPTWVAGFENGFLRTDLVAVGDVAPTIVPAGAEYWRMFADGRQEFVSVWRGPALGWANTQAYAAPVEVGGPRAQWQGAQYVASWPDAEHVDLTRVSTAAVEGFEQTRPHVWTRRVAASECERFYALEVTTEWRGHRVTVHRIGPDVVTVLAHVSAAEAAELGAITLEPGVFLAEAPRSELGELETSAFAPVSR